MIWGLGSLGDDTQAPPMTAGQRPPKAPNTLPGERAQGGFSPVSILRPTEIPMTIKLNGIDEHRFWREVYLACVTDPARLPDVAADFAVEEYRERQERPPMFLTPEEAEAHLADPEDAA